MQFNQKDGETKDTGASVSHRGRDASGLLRPKLPTLWLIVLLACLGTLIYGFTAYSLANSIRGIPPYVTVLFAFAVLGALALAVMVAGSLLELYRNARAGLRGARLHRRLVGLLSLVAIIPAIIASALTGTVLRAFSDEYFVERVTEANLVARDLANGYVTAESREVGLQVVQLASDLARQAQSGLTPEAAPIGFRRYLLGQTILRGFSSVTILDEAGRVVAEVAPSGETYRLPPQSDFAAVSAPGASPFKFSVHDREALDAWYAILHLGAPSGGYLIAYKAENPALSDQLLSVRAFRDQTAEVRERLADLSRMFAAGYALVLILLLLGAVWIGLIVANAIVGPVRRLATAAEAVSGGDFKSRVQVHRHDGELGELGETFNEMTRQLEAQRDDLIATGEQAEARRRFIETVVSSVPAGVLTIRRDGSIALANPSAALILRRKEETLVGDRVEEAAPELLPLLAQAGTQSVGEIRDQIELTRAGRTRIINVRIRPDDSAGRTGFVVTLDDITELVAAQRNAAWGDVARRIAHEIKNPLTPIQLAAERLKRRYGNKLEDDREVFDRCTETIIRHVGDIGHMVSEFSSLARMPVPVLATADLRDVAKSAAFSVSVANPQVTFDYQLGNDPVTVQCDSRLTGQAIVNVVKNAVEAITEDPSAKGGTVIVRVRAEGRFGITEVIDNGRGLPLEDRARLTEPYMTTRAKGTGLGLAIVRKAIEEQGGTVSLLDGGIDGGRGATARIALPLFQHAQDNVDAPNRDEASPRAASLPEESTVS